MEGLTHLGKSSQQAYMLLKYFDSTAYCKMPTSFEVKIYNNRRNT